MTVSALSSTYNTLGTDAATHFHTSRRTLIPWLIISAILGPQVGLWASSRGLHRQWGWKCRDYVFSSFYICRIVVGGWGGGVHTARFIWSDHLNVTGQFCSANKLTDANDMLWQTQMSLSRADSPADGLNLKILGRCTWIWILFPHSTLD